MNTEETTEVVVEELSPEQAAINERKERQLLSFAENESTLAKCRAFWDKHQDTLMRFRPDMVYGFLLQCEFPSYANDPKEVAKAFGPHGWVRQKNAHTCGVIDWTKEVDGVTLIIRGAEKAPDLRPEVRIA
jgi:hypothetical protein